MKKFFLSALHLCIAIFANSQNDFQKAFVVKNNNDTIVGFIKSTTAEDMASKIIFKTAEDAQLQTFTTDDIKSFRFDGGNTFDVIQFWDALDDNRRKTEFARLVMSGYYYLYAISSDSKDNYFIKSSSDTGIFLFDSYIDRATVANVYGNYKGVLDYLARDCDKIRAELEKLYFSEKSLAYYVGKLNECLAPGSSRQYAHKLKWKKEVPVYVGGITAGNEKNQVQAQIVFRVRTLERSKKISLNAGVAFMKWQDTYGYSDFNLGGVGQYHKTRQYINIATFVQYNFTTGIIQPYIVAGLSCGKYKEELRQTYKNSFGETLENVTDKTNFLAAFLGGVGIEIFPIKRLAIKAEWRYEIFVQRPTVGLSYSF